jgi:hypothetical protein
MTEIELIELRQMTSVPWKTNALLNTWLQGKEASTGDPVASKGVRTPSQNAAMHLWFSQIAEICQQQGVTGNLIIKHTHDLMMTEHTVKGLWKALQVALYGKTSTRELKKSGEIDNMIDHMVALFAKEEVEIPPFPVNEKKHLEGVRIESARDVVEYPQMDKSPLL